MFLIMVPPSWFFPHRSIRTTEFGTVPYRPGTLQPRRPLPLTEDITTAKDITCVLNLDETESSNEGRNKEVKKEEGTMDKGDKKSATSSSSSSSVNNNNNNNNNNNDGSDVSTRLKDMLMNWTEPDNPPGDCTSSYCTSSCTPSSLTVLLSCILLLFLIYTNSLFIFFPCTTVLPCNHYLNTLIDRPGMEVHTDASAKGPRLGINELKDCSDNNEIDYSNHPILERCPWLVRVRMIETALIQDLVDQQQAQVQ